ncbi:MAG: sigma-70 family RNA polymerase sigma factor [Muribaculaceae bacterium]|nr:sigma-70 family RNA polymerase sigma factor [Muribaculaceae bacterium]
MNELKQEFEKLIKREKSTVYSICLMFAPDKASANDLAQEALINIWLGLPKFKGQSSMHTWVYRITLNTCLSFKRKKKLPSAGNIEIDPSIFSTETSEGRNTRLLHKRIQMLEPFDRAIVLLWLENISYDEIGAIAGITAKAVGVRLVRIREKLKNINVTE